MNSLQLVVFDTYSLSPLPVFEKHFSMSLPIFNNKAKVEDEVLLDSEIYKAFIPGQIRYIDMMTEEGHVSIPILGEFNLRKMLLDIEDYKRLFASRYPLAPWESYDPNTYRWIVGKNEQLDGLARIIDKKVKTYGGLDTVRITIDFDIKTGEKK